LQVAWIGAEQCNVGYDTYDVRTWPVAVPLTPHARAAALHAAARDIPKPTSYLLNQVALLYKTKAQYAAAEPLHRQALAIAEAALGKEHPAVATCLNNLAQLLQDTNRLSEAEAIFRRALAIDEAAFGKDHPIFASALNNLAWLLQDTNRLAEAEPLMRRVVAIHPIRVQPGTAQQSVYKWHLDNPPDCATLIAAMGAQLQCLRQAALCPWSLSLSRPGLTGARSSEPWSPKLLAILHLAADLMARGEQLVVFSPFQEFSTALKAALTAAAVPSLLLDGRIKNTKRGPLSADFKAGQYPVLIAGIDAMGEGHSFECAAHLVIPSLSWAYDSNRQCMDRVHRLTSAKDVTIYLMITSNSIDERLAAIFQEKGDASDLALDGRLFDEDKKEVSLADLIRSAAIDFDPAAATIPESAVMAEWDHSLRTRLTHAAQSFALSRNTATATPVKPTKSTAGSSSSIKNPKSTISTHQSNSASPLSTIRSELADLYALMTATDKAPSTKHEIPNEKPAPPEHSDQSDKSDLSHSFRVLAFVRPAFFFRGQHPRPLHAVAMEERQQARVQRDRPALSRLGTPHAALAVSKLDRRLLHRHRSPTAVRRQP
jgi:tetratricopeptide (TPR) repeat protein